MGARSTFSWVLTSRSRAVKWSQSSAQVEQERARCFTYSALWTTVFLAIGIGAIGQVIWEVGRLIQRSQARAGEPLFTWNTLGGITAGIAVMYGTALLV